MDLSTILNVDDMPVYQRPSSPGTDSSHGTDTPRTPGETSPVMSYNSRSPGSKRFKSEHRLPRGLREDTLSPGDWMSSPYTTLDTTPSSREQQRTSIDGFEYGIAKKPASSLFSPESPRAFSPTPLRIPGNGVGGPYLQSPAELKADNCISNSTRTIKKHKRDFTPRPHVRSNSCQQREQMTEPHGLPSSPVETQVPDVYGYTTRCRNMSSAASERLPGVAEILCQAMPGTQPADNHESHAYSYSKKVKKAIGDGEPRNHYVDADDSDGTISVDSDRDQAPGSHVHHDNAQKCAYMADCPLNSPVRRVISHYFGRNKKETRAIPDDVWVNYCRQHYQRAKYRQKPEAFAETQMKLVKATVANLQQWGGVEDFDVSLRKRAVDQIAKEDAALAAAAKAGIVGRALASVYQHPPCEERWMQPFTGKKKSFAEVFALIDMVTRHSLEHKTRATEFEVVPNIKPHLMKRREPNKRTMAKAAGSNKMQGFSTSSGKTAGAAVAEAGAGAKTKKLPAAAAASSGGGLRQSAAETRKLPRRGASSRL